MKNAMKTTDANVDSTIVGHTIAGWTVRTGDRVQSQRGEKFLLLGREGNLLLVRPFVPRQPTSVVRVSRIAGSIPVLKKHPAELGLRSTVTLPHYVR